MFTVNSNCKYQLCLKGLMSCKPSRRITVFLSLDDGISTRETKVLPLLIPKMATRYDAGLVQSNSHYLHLPIWLWCLCYFLVRPSTNPPPSKKNFHQNFYMHSMFPHSNHMLFYTSLSYKYRVTDISHRVRSSEFLFLLSSKVQKYFHENSVYRRL